MFEPKRLHPISAVINFVKGLKDALFPLVALFFLNGGFSGEIEWIPLTVTSAILLFILVGGIVRWLRFTYRMEEGELRIEYGLFIRKKRYIPIERIQSLDFSEGIFHRPFQLVKVSVETAGSGNDGAEAELTAIHKQEAEELEEMIAQYKQDPSISEGDEVTEQETAESVSTPLYEMRMKEIILMAITSGGAGVVLSGVGVFFSQVMDALPLGAIYQEIVDWIQIGVLIVAFTAILVLAIAYVISIVLTLFRYANFRVMIQDDDLIITRGWLEKKQTTIPINRIQGLRIDENIIRQPLGYASVTIISAGGAIMQGDENQLRLLPFIKKAEISAVMQRILEDYTIDVEFSRPPRRALPRYIVRQSWLFWIAVIPVSIYFFPLGLLSILVALGATALGWLAYYDAGWNLTGKQLTLRSRSILKQTFIMKKHRIQSAYKKQTILQKRIELSHIQVALKSGAGGQFAECNYLREDTVDQLMDWYQPDPKKVTE
ncbi:hypothetical protein E4663_10475 [Halobacillus salinus]|uniref:YdbS-like PH domain-containing protein n=2 Tax=Halobacillus salinus TaxID=192814 RepID=A0A4Z0H9L3_9BACI|nr:hypothetical protein E4663_10475 [Halobacillus salinus]